MLSADGLLLAGGQNSRMQGEYKGNLFWNGECFADRMIRELKKVSSTVYVSYGEKDWGEKENCIIVRDVFPSCGPLGGLEACLSVCGNAFVFAAACDLPFLKGEFFQYLAACAEKEKKLCGEYPDCVVTTRSGRPEPLAAVYGKRSLPVVRGLLQEKKYKMRFLLDAVNTLYVPLADDSPFCTMLTNINTPEEYRKIQEEKIVLKENRWPFDQTR